MKIAQFILNQAQHSLTINFAESVGSNRENQQGAELSFEYLRISSPNELAKKAKQGQVVCHKKEVNLSRIESVAKHGYRFIFDDEHSAIYSEDYIQTLIAEQDSRWQSYLVELKASGHSRETMIDFKQL
ncbi:gamma-butyrobetaine hydroxylase-like domain-containing protein [Colwellia sp. E2M01]|uniref:gamma-butyrobetaine hydroxylase-like domain-containing protein n=1 Tax=Colwellia sp. E2M01 TaxID=2841561 RepID=UPI001C0928D5|nr:gamma-butyrobetaine hydroxylase-like domain-containing protein [Colwellia sp. E2M01]MBU2870129.1 DUF971 domain-containing protein [Colwellia sp. E2M01]